MPSWCFSLPVFLLFCVCRFVLHSLLQVFSEGARVGGTGSHLRLCLIFLSCFAFHLSVCGMRVLPIVCVCLFLSVFYHVFTRPCGLLPHVVLVLSVHTYFRGLASFLVCVACLFSFRGSLRTFMLFVYVCECITCHTWPRCFACPSKPSCRSLLPLGFFPLLFFLP